MISAHGHFKVEAGGFGAYVVGHSGEGIGAHTHMLARAAWGQPLLQNVAVVVLGPRPEYEAHLTCSTCGTLWISAKGGGR
jgi:hypothetical protein